MRRRLLLFRHSKAERSQPGSGDHARVLTERGRADAVRLGLYLASHGLAPDHALISSAARTRETWALAAAALRPAPPADFDARIYDAEPQTLFEVVAAAPANAQALVLVGHNPGLHELAMLLIASGDIDTRERLRENLPTSGLVVIDFAFERWADLHPRAGRLERFISPDVLESSAS
jgi:phosphohistidine phosphatase